MHGAQLTKNWRSKQVITVGSVLGSVEFVLMMVVPTCTALHTTVAELIDLYDFRPDMSQT